MYLRFKAWLTKGRVIYLRDHQKRVYKSVLYIDPFGEMRCKVKVEGGPPHSLHIVLLEGGKVESDNSSAYTSGRAHTFIKDWILA